jgi:hypothetical protein
MKGGLKLNEALYKGLFTRLEQVSNRLTALEKERSILLTEKTHLKDLITIYKNMEYDSIEEERRVTSAMLKEEAAPAKEPATRQWGGARHRGVSMYDEPIETIFKTMKNPINIQDITQELNTLMNRNDIPTKQTITTLQKFIKRGTVTRIRQGFYTWTGDNKIATTSTIPD